MPTFKNVSSDAVEIPSLGITIDAESTVVLTDDQAAQIGTDHPVLKPDTETPAPPAEAAPVADDTKEN